MARSRNKIWPFLLAALALLALWNWLHQPARPHVTPQPALETYNGCGMEGDASNPAVRELNLLKNRYTAPDPQQIDPRVTLDAMLDPGDDRGRWNDRHAAEITGYVWDVKVGGVETVNCRATDPPDRDTHIELVLDPLNSSETRRVIVEVTPRWRSIAEQHGEDWSTRALRDHFQGRWVRVRGWLLFDTEHESQSVNTAPNRPRDWRATAWEIHPVTSLEVVDRPK
ncbi:MAG TPA: hypothetical protein VNH65_03300 [Candidatus Acidoferrum sp.]|nr:hypothetical protein [Candidatus Acidoferrum sp.]